MEVLLHGGTVVSAGPPPDSRGYPDSFAIAQTAMPQSTPLRLRKLKAHGLLARDGKRYVYRLTEKGTKVALLFILFHKQLCGPLPTASFTIGPTMPNGQQQARSGPPQGRSLHPKHHPTAQSCLTLLKYSCLRMKR